MLRLFNTKCNDIIQYSKLIGNLKNKSANNMIKHLYPWMTSYSSFWFCGPFYFHNPSKCTKTKTCYKNKKKKKKRNSPLPLSPVTTTTKTNRWLETAVKPRCISLRCGRQTRGNKNLNFLKSCPLFSKNLFLFLNIGQALATTPPLSTVFPEQRRT